ncbi:MAG: hypothetical protein IT531_07495 [Burkholderiales bacterium]|nr:hypothetical protein [Burkholderiales bacterium]
MAGDTELQGARFEADIAITELVDDLQNPAHILVGQFGHEIQISSYGMAAAMRPLRG